MKPLIMLLFLPCLMGAQSLPNKFNTVGSYRADITLNYQRSQPITENFNLVGRLGFGITFVDPHNPGEEIKNPALVGVSIYLSKISVQALAGNTLSGEVRADVNRFRISAGYQNLYNTKLLAGELTAGVEVIIYGEFYGGSCYEDAYGRLFTVSFNSLHSLNTQYKGLQVGLNWYLN